MPPDSSRKTGSGRGVAHGQGKPGEEKDARDGEGLSGGDLGEVFFEFRPIGNYMRVDAIHARTGIETYVLGPRNAPPNSLQMLALRKLKTVLDRKT
ncbi:MAG: hypothetical protein L3J67_06360 [Hyphomicrobiaceae bacterium]|nr:hypothetical protein [Hyphomicrobiaceae bacterium]